MAVTRGHGEVMEILLSCGCSVRMCDHEGFSLLCLAVIHGHGARIRALLDRGAMQDESVREERQSARIGHRNSAIQIAAWLGRRDLVVTLLHSGSEPISPSAKQMQNAVQSALQQGHKDIIPLLVDYGVDLNFWFRDACFPGECSPLLWAVAEGDLHLAALLLGSGKADANYLLVGK